MLNVMITKCNEVISNTQIFKDNNLLTKKIFDDCVEYILSKGYSSNIKLMPHKIGILKNERIEVDGYPWEMLGKSK